MAEIQKHILVVDDDQPIVALISAHLYAEGYDVDMAFSGEGALGKVKNKKPDIVLLDLRLPGIDGIETLNRIKAVDGKILAVMVTGVYDAEECKRAFDAGASDYVTKPIDFQYLKNTIYNFLA